MNAMPGDTSRTRIHIGEIYFQWDSKDRHYLVLDLTGPLPEWVVEAGGRSCPWRSTSGGTRAGAKRYGSRSAAVY
jgi:hypothetical protein